MEIVTKEGVTPTFVLFAKQKTSPDVGGGVVSERRKRFLLNWKDGNLIQ